MTLRIATWILFGCAFAAHFVVASPGPPLAPGEQLKYSVSWAIVAGAGEIVVSAEPEGRDQLKITTNTATRRLARLLLRFDATAEATYDLKTGHMLALHDWSDTRGKHVEHRTTFNYDTREARYAVIGDTTAKSLTIPDGSPTDLITALLETRNWDMKPGEKRDALVIFNDDFYELTIHALRYEDVTTNLGSFRALVLQPRMEKTPPKGMFKKGTTVQVWISQEDRHLPLKFEVEFNIGTGTATLVDYTPPRGPSPAVTPSAPDGKK